MRTFATLACLVTLSVSGAEAQDTTTFTRADTLRGSNGPERAWWDAAFYDLHVRSSPPDSTVRGWNGITYRVLGPAREMQIDLQAPLVVDSIGAGWPRPRASVATATRFFVDARRAAAQRRTRKTITVLLPRAAARRASAPPWDGGFIWAHGQPDGSPWIVTAAAGDRRQRLVADQGHPGRRARQPARRRSRCPTR